MVDGQRHRAGPDTHAEEFFERPRQLTEWIEPAAGIAFFVGLAFNLWVQLILLSGLNNQLPIPLVGAPLAALIYAVLGQRPPRLDELLTKP